MDNTAYYNENASKFIEDTMNADMSGIRNRFLSHLPQPWGRCPQDRGGVTKGTDNITILDAGCGPGRDSRAFKELGFDVYAMDASEAMVEHCRTIIGDRVILSTFQEYSTEMKFDGIWACASLLHLEPHDLNIVIKKFAGFLKSGGVFFMSFKYGTENYVKDGRHFNCQTEESITDMITSLHPDHSGPLLSIAEIFITEDVRPGRAGERWVNVIARNA